MFLDHLKRHGHGHGHGHHKKMQKHGGKHGHFKHPGGRHMGHGRKHFRGMDFDRACCCESEVPDTTTPNIEAGTNNALENNLPRGFHKRRHYWRCERCFGEKNVQPADNAEGNATTTVDEGDKAAGEATAKNLEGQDKTEELCSRRKHHFRYHGGKVFRGPCLRCMQKDGNITDNDATTDGEKGENVKEVELRNHHRGHYKGKSGHGFGKLCKHCKETSGTESEGATEDERGVKHGYVRKHHRGHHGSRKEHTFGRGGHEHGRHHHGGKWGHGMRHHGGWRRHGCCILMVDASMNTGDIETGGNESHELNSREDLNAGQNMEQDANQEVGQDKEQTGVENIEVLEVANNLRKSSLE